MEQNILEYLKCMDILLDNVTVTKITDDQQYQIAVNDIDENVANEKMQAIIAQVDRDEDQLVVMNSVEALSHVIKQPELTENPNGYAIIVSVVPVIR